MALIRNNAEGGTDDLAVTPANSGGVSGDAWTLVSLAGTATITFDNGQSIGGAMAYKFNTNGTDIHYLQWTATGSNQIADRGYFYFPSLPTAGNGVYQLRTSGGGTSFTTCVVRNDGSFQISDVTGAFIFTSSAGVIPAATVLRFEIQIANPSATTGTVSGAWYLGDSTTPITGTVFNLTGQNFGTSLMSQVRWGRPSAFGTFASFWGDSFAHQDGSITPIGPAINAPPTVNAGVDQNVAASASVLLSASAADSDGAVVSYAWTWVYHPTAANIGTATGITGATTSTPSFTAGAAGSLYILRCTVTDNAGGSAYDDVEIRVPVTGATAKTPLAMDATVKVGTWTRVGGSATDGQAVSDVSDLTYLESGNVSATEQTIEIRAIPSNSIATGKMEPVRMATDTGSANTVVRLVQGSTVLETFNQAINALPTDYTFTLAPGTIAAISDPGSLRWRIGALI